MKKGFTLIELLVVIAIIGLLSSIVLVSLGPARKKARDARRQSDIRQISLAMEMCSDDSACSTVGSYKAIDVTSGRLTTTAIGTYMPTIPSDPGGGSGTCTGTTDGEMAIGYYCGFTSAAGSEYCIFAKLSNNTWFAASEKGVSTMTTPPTSYTVCP
jgi:prepilin-type N-terminal cleavage/methylation domain-containing protein